METVYPSFELIRNQFDNDSPLIGVFPHKYHIDRWINPTHLTQYYTITQCRAITEAIKKCHCRFLHNDNGRESFCRKVFFIFTLHNTSNHNDCLKLGASNLEEGATWIHALKDVAKEPGTNSKRRWQPFRLDDCKGSARKRSVDWTSSAYTHVDTITSNGCGYSKKQKILL